MSPLLRRSESALLDRLREQAPTYEQAVRIADNPAYAPGGAAVASAYSAGYHRAVEALRVLVEGGDE